MSIVENVRILPGYKTDHSIIEIELIINYFQRGKGFWHVNNSHMKNKDYVSNVKKNNPGDTVRILKSKF